MPAKSWRSSLAERTVGRKRVRRGPESIEPAQLDLEDFGVEEENGAESLILCGGGDIPLSGEVSEEGRDLGDTTITRMAEALGRFREADVPFDPGEVGFLGSRGVVMEAQRVADLIEEFHGSPS
jgi:hypothetical protein